MARSAAQQSRRRKRELIAVGAAGAYGWAESREGALWTVGDVHPALLYGVALYALPELGVRGQAGDMMRSAATGLLCVAAADVGRTGTLQRGESLRGYDEYAGYDDGYDDMDDAA